MLTAHDFRHLYDYGILPNNSIKITNQKYKNTDNSDYRISKEWARIEIKLNSIAKAFLDNNSKNFYPPCFYINIKYYENVKRLREELFFKIQRRPCIFSFDSYIYCLEF